MILGFSLDGCTVLDLFAGSGALGIEALSRGARHAVFFDQNIACIRAIHENLDRCGFKENATVLKGRFPDENERIKTAISGTYDIVFLDPPYGVPEKDRILEKLDRFSLLSKNARIVFEHASNDQIDLVPQGFVLEKQRRYGDTMLTFLTYQPREKVEDDG